MPVFGVFFFFFEQELWNHKQLIEVDCSENGEVLSLVCFKDKLFSGHADGTIKVTHQSNFLLILIFIYF